MIAVNNIPVKNFLFPGGEAQITLEGITLKEKTEIWAFLDTADEIMKLLMAVDAVRRIQPYTEIELHIPYFPYARQDRVCNPGEALAVKVMANLINSLKAQKVVLYDPHSDVTPALLNNAEIIPQEKLLTELTEVILEKQLALIAPDAGATKKTMKFAQILAQHTTPEVFFGSKVRDTKTGKITATTITGDVAGKNVLIIDDICDGGRTFIELAKVLKAEGAAEIYLYVTHGIFSKGIEVLTPYFHHIYTYFAFPKIEAHEKLTILHPIN